MKLIASWLIGTIIIVSTLAVGLGLLHALIWLAQLIGEWVVFWLLALALCSPLAVAIGEDW